MKRMAFALTTVVLLCSNHLSVHAQTASNDLIAKLKIFSSAHPAEKVYLQFDKPYYAAGDTLYFKAYVTMGERHVLSRISGVLHVDLINTKDKIDQSIKLRLADGVAWGDFALPDSLPKGNYRVRAWTQWTRNDSNFFEKVIPIGSLQNTKVTESSMAHVAVNARPDMQFFPEGGSLVMGVRSKLAFKAIGSNGLGLTVAGEVIDNDNKRIVSFASIHLGMGSFALTPEPGKTYRAKLTYANGYSNIIDLPKAEDSGIALSVNNDSIPAANVRIEANRAFFKENKGKNYTLLIYSGGIATSVPCSLDSTVITLDILKRKLFTGITTITLFSPTNEPLCERPIFVQNYDQLNLNISTDKTSYSAREKVTLELSAKTRADSAAMGHFSVSVTAESKVPVDDNSETTILTDLLFTSDLKGYIEQPNYYFNSINDKTTSDLDLVMLTHGYRRFEWKRLLNNGYPSPAYQPETDLEIKGKVTNVLGKPVSHGTVTLIPARSGPLLTQATDDKGNFRFAKLFFTDTGNFVLNATKANGKNSTQIVYRSEQSPAVAPWPLIDAKTNTDTLMMPYLENYEKTQEELNRLGLGKGRMLKEVKIKAKKKPDYRSESLVPEESADQVIRGDQLPYGGALSIRLMQVAHRVKWLAAQHGPNFKPTMTVYIDGVKGDIDQVRPDQVEVIEILLPPTSYIYGPDGINGVIDITTKPGGRDVKDIVSTGVLPITLQGFYKVRTFYAPKYDHPDSAANRKDLRSTIYWQPEVLTDKDGNASIAFYNADGTGNYRVVVEGMDEKGISGGKCTVIELIELNGLSG